MRRLLFALVFLAGMLSPLRSYAALATFTNYATNCKASGAPAILTCNTPAGVQANDAMYFFATYIVPQQAPITPSGFTQAVIDSSNNGFANIVVYRKCSGGTPGSGENTTQTINFTLTGGGGGVAGGIVAVRGSQCPAATEDQSVDNGHGNGSSAGYNPLPGTTSVANEWVLRFLGTQPTTATLGSVSGDTVDVSVNPVTSPQQFGIQESHLLITSPGSSVGSVGSSPYSTNLSGVSASITIKPAAASVAFTGQSVSPNMQVLPCTQFGNAGSYKMCSPSTVATLPGTTGGCDSTDFCTGWATDDGNACARGQAPTGGGVPPGCLVVKPVGSAAWIEARAAPQHTATPTPAPIATPTATPSSTPTATPSSTPTPVLGAVVKANDFLNTIGVATHMTQGADAPANVQTALQYTGIRNIRDDGTTNSSNLTSYIGIHNAIGTKFDLLPINGNVTNSISEYETMAAAHALLAAEGPNEINNFPFTYGTACSIGTTYLPCAQFTSDLYNAVKADSNLTGIPVFAPSEAGGSEPDNVGLQFLTIPSSSGLTMPDGTIYGDYMNTHNYLMAGGLSAPINNTAWGAEASCPGEGPWDGPSGEYGPTTWNKHFTGYSCPTIATLPKVTTETGWITSGTNAITEDQQGKLFLNLYLSAVRRSWAYTFVYMLHDSASQGFWGLYHTDWTPKLSATYLHNLTTLLADTTSFFTPGSVSYSIPSEPSTVHDMRIEQSNGTHNIAVWGDQVSGSNPITVNLGANYSVSVYDPTVSASSPTQTLSNASSVSLTMSDHPFIIRLGAPISSGTFSTALACNSSAVATGGCSFNGVTYGAGGFPLPALSAPTNVVCNNNSGDQGLLHTAVGVGGTAGLHKQVLISGTCDMTAALFIPNYTDLQCQLGAVIHNPTSNSYASFEANGSHDITIRNCTATGVNTTPPFYPGATIGHGGPEGDSFFFLDEDGSNITLQDNLALNTTGQAAMEAHCGSAAPTCSNVHFDWNTFDGCALYGATLDNVANGSTSHNYNVDCRVGNEYDGAGQTGGPLTTDYNYQRRRTGYGYNYSYCGGPQLNDAFCVMHSNPSCEFKGNIVDAAGPTSAVGPNCSGTFGSESGLISTEGESASGFSQNYCYSGACTCTGVGSPGCQIAAPPNPAPSGP